MPKREVETKFYTFNQNNSGGGYQVCECGATRRVEQGAPFGAWHTCKLCVVES